MQNHYNLLYREEEREMMKLCLDQQIGVLPWSPLARGRLSRPWNERQASERAGSDASGRKLYSHTEEADQQVVERLAQVAQARGVSMSQLALAWHFTKPYVTAPIIGATKLAHLDDALAATKLQLTPAEIEHLESEYVPHPVLGFE
jgi:aryl-alcohol dehydrogenase-like predicted oxidoreductase